MKGLNHMRKSLLTTLLLLHSLCLSAHAEATTPTSTPPGNVPNDNAQRFPIKISVGATLKTLDLVAPHIILMTEPLSDGLRYFHPLDAADFLNALSKNKSLWSPNQEEIMRLYDNRSDVSIFLKSILEGDYLKIRIKGARIYTELAKEINLITGASKAQTSLLSLVELDRITVTRSALDHILEAQKGLGFIGFVKSLALSKGWNLNQLVDSSVKWTSVELLDLRFNVTRQNSKPLSGEQVRFYQELFSKRILHSTFSNITDQGVLESLQKIAEEYNSGRAYDAFNSKLKLLRGPSTAGFIVGTLTAVGASIGSALSWLSMIPAQTPHWIGIGGLAVSFSAIPSLSSYLIYLLDQKKLKAKQEKKILSIANEFKKSQPVKNSLNSLVKLRCHSFLL